MFVISANLNAWVIQFDYHILEKKITIMVSKHDLMRLLKFINCAFLDLNNIVHTKRQRTTTSNIQYALYNLLNIFSTNCLQKFSTALSITLSALGNLR